MSFQRLKDHVLSQHNDFVSSESPGVPEVVLLNDYGDPDVPNTENLEDWKWSATSEVNVQQSFMKFITTIGSKPGISQNAVQMVTEELGSLVHDVKDYAVQTIHQLCDQLSVSHSDPHVSSAVSNLSDVPNFLSDVDTQHKRNKWLINNGYLIQPVEIVLGTRTEFRYSSLVRRTRPVIVEDTYQYIPLNKLLGKLLEDPVAVSIMNSHRSFGMAEYPRMRDFCDTSTFKQNHFFQMHPDAFMLHLFVDAFETVNVLGSHTTIHKLEGLYCVLRNFPNMYLSKTNSIFLLGLWHSLDVKR